jgi:uncharacterized protein DUF2877
MEITTQPPVTPAWASTAVSGLLSGPPRDLLVLASTGPAAYLADPGPGPPAVALALLAEGAVRLPLGVCVGAGSLPEAGTTARAGDGAVTAAGRTWRPVRWWDPRPRLDALALLRYGPGLLGVVHDAPAPAFGLALAGALAVAGALAAGDPAPAVGVIGLGPGLTPAADDVIAGALAVLALTGRLDGSVRRAVEGRAATHTTGLSAALLVAAGRGEVIPPAARVLSVLAAGAPAGRLATAVGGLFSVGHTSGHDLCAGMAGALAFMGGR